MSVEAPAVAGLVAALTKNAGLPATTASVSAFALGVRLTLVDPERAREWEHDIERWLAHLHEVSPEQIEVRMTESVQLFADILGKLEA